MKSNKVMKLIDKAALVAEIRKSLLPTVIPQGTNYDEFEKGADNERIRILSLIDTLEVKEVKEEPISEDLEKAIGQSFIYHENHGDDFRSDKQIETAYRYGFRDGYSMAEKNA